MQKLGSKIWITMRLVKLNPDAKIFGKVCHLKAEKILEYLTYYNNPNKNIKPQSRLVPLIHREYQPGGSLLDQTIRSIND